MAEQAVPDDEKTVRRLDGRHRLRNKRSPVGLLPDSRQNSGPRRQRRPAAGRLRGTRTTKSAPSMELSAFEG